MKKLFDKYGKKKVYLIGLIASLSVLVTFIVYGLMYDNPLELKQESFVVEYGDTVSTNAKTYLKSDDNDILENAKIDLSELKKEKDKEYIAVGKYDAKVSYKKNSIDFVIEVKDTKAPVFKELLENIVLEQNAEDVDFTKFFKAEDLSDVKITVESKKVDLKNIGFYEIKVTAKDKYDNAVTRNVKVEVVSLEDASKENGTTKTLDGTVYQSKAMKEKVAEEQKVEEENKKEQNNIPASNGNTSNNGGGNVTNGNTNNGSTNGGSTQPSKPNVCVPDGNFGRVGNSGKVFSSKAEADTFAETYIMAQGDVWTYTGWYAWTVHDNCGERNDVWTVDFY